jgi:hypothetical protein
VVCIDGLEDSTSVVKTATTTIQAMEEATSASAQPAETHPALVKEAEVEFFSTGSEVMDDILEHSQQRMLEAFAHLSKRVDGLAAHRPAPRSAADQAPADIAYVLFVIYPRPRLTSRTALGHLRTRIETIETRQQDFLQIMNQLRKTIQVWDQDLHEQNVSSPPLYR